MAPKKVSGSKPPGQKPPTTPKTPPEAASNAGQPPQPVLQEPLPPPPPPAAAPPAAPPQPVPAKVDVAPPSPAPLGPVDDAERLKFLMEQMASFRAASEKQAASLRDSLEKVEARLAAVEARAPALPPPPSGPCALLAACCGCVPKPALNAEKALILRRPKHRAPQRHARVVRATRGPAEPNFGSAEGAKWVFKEMRSNGGCRYITMGKQEQVSGRIAVGLETFRANPSKFLAISFQEDMVPAMISHDLHCSPMLSCALPRPPTTSRDLPWPPTHSGQLAGRSAKVHAARAQGHQGLHRRRLARRMDEGRDGAVPAPAAPRRPWLRQRRLHRSDGVCGLPAALGAEQAHLPGAWAWRRRRAGPQDHRRCRPL